MRSFKNISDRSRFDNEIKALLEDNIDLKKFKPINYHYIKIAEKQTETPNFFSNHVKIFSKKVKHILSPKSI